MTSGLFGTVLNIYANEKLGFTLPEVGYMMGARSIGFVLAMFTMGKFADNIGRKPVLLFGLLGTSSLNSDEWSQFTFFYVRTYFFNRFYFWRNLDRWPRCLS
jgi:MFS family permease